MEERAVKGGSELSPWHQHVRPNCSNLETQTRVRFPGFLPRVKRPLLLGAPSLPAGELRCSACRSEHTRGSGMLTSRWRMEVSSELERKLPAGPVLMENRRWGRGQQATCTSCFADGLPSDPLWQPWGAPAFSKPSHRGSLRQMTLASPRGQQRNFLSVNSHRREDPKLTTSKTLPSSSSQDLRLIRLTDFPVIFI